VHPQRRGSGRAGEREGRRLLEDRRLRVAGALGMLGMVVVHLMDLPEKQEEAPYMAAMFEALIVACLVLAPALLLSRPPLVRYIWIASGTLALLTVVGFILSRSIGLPRLEDHVGDWENPVGVASLILEAVVIVASAMALRAGDEATEVTT
jgi:hypothetical protein